MASHYFRNFHVNCTKKKRRQLINALVHMRVLLSQARHLQCTLSVVFFLSGNSYRFDRKNENKMFAYFIFNVRSSVGGKK